MCTRTDADIEEYLHRAFSIQQTDQQMLDRHRQAVMVVRIGGGTVYMPHLSNIQTLSIGKKAKIHSHVWIGERVRIGENANIQAFAFIPDGVLVGDHVFIGPRVTFTNDKYPPSDIRAITKVQDSVSVGAGAVILPGITLGHHCIVGAGSVVTRDVPPEAVVWGSPAKPRGEA